MSISAGFTTAEIHEFVLEYQAQPYGRKAAWLEGRGVADWQLRKWRAAVFEGDLDRGLIPREGSPMTVPPQFKAIAESFGLEIEHDAKIGWSVTTLPADAATHYGQAIAALDSAITAHRRAELHTAEGGRKSNNNGAAAVCGCGRKIRASLVVLDAGPIICGLCGDEFTPEES